MTIFASQKDNRPKRRKIQKVFPRRTFTPQKSFNFRPIFKNNFIARQRILFARISMFSRWEWGYFLMDKRCLWCLFILHFRLNRARIAFIGGAYVSFCAIGISCKFARESLESGYIRNTFRYKSRKTFTPRKKVLTFSKRKTFARKYQMIQDENGTLFDE